jgi:hypothetical protein
MPLKKQDAIQEIYGLLNEYNLGLDKLTGEAANRLLEAVKRKVKEPA